jgi:hypothetical protein
MKMYWGSGDTVPRNLNLSTRWKWLASRPSRFIPYLRAQCTRWIGVWRKFATVKITGLNMSTQRKEKRSPKYQVITKQKDKKPRTTIIMVM